MARSDMTQFVVEILEGPSADDSITLEGRSLPYRAGAGGSVSYGRTQRTKLTWYPGNPIASQQIVGRVLKPTIINGVWKERYLGENRPIALVERFEELVDTGVQVRVSWSTIVRVGIVKDIEWAPGDPTGGLSDIRWAISFEWNSADDAPTRTVGEAQVSLRSGCVDGASAIGDIVQSIGDLVGRFKYALGVKRIAFAPDRDELEELETALDVPIKTVVSAAARMGDEVDLSARLLNDVSAAFESSQTLGGRAATVASGIFPATSTVSDGLTDVLADALARAKVEDAVYDGLAEIFDVRRRVETLARPEVFARIPALVGGDLRKVAIQFYGDADLWNRIAQVNGILDSRIPEDINDLVIPLQLSDATDPAMGT